MEWAEETIVRLRALWDEGLSTAEIGRRLGVSKNGVVGKAHRLDLPARPSPIRREGPPGSTPRRSQPRRVAAGPTLPPLLSASAVSTAPPLVPPKLPAAAPTTTPVHAPAATQAQRLALPPSPRAYGRAITCCWPIGEPGTRSFDFCSAESVPGKPYCEQHAQMAYVKVRDRREDAV
ncbi:MAG: GcrA cell cycle regulator [Patescibacteria group bacterium]|nr:GcrA cell cycle regulator [Patescibacteria group bacterium]MDE1944303.1 GcrA cell cycle regulator [Patescibacteria group bacterium]MDE1945294.1 GcrA cell cycle regulator [Patescibacteria group bacterium]MDE2057871.1 GcrA cell cycle regulator [Patescibacteria group bacterium]